MRLDERVVMGHQFPPRNAAFKKVDGPGKNGKDSFGSCFSKVYEPFYPDNTIAWAEPYMSNHSVWQFPQVHTHNPGDYKSRALGKGFS